MSTASEPRSNNATNATRECCAGCRTRPPDVILLQEIRASHKQADDALAPALASGWHLTMTESSVKGHAGVGVLSRTEPVTRCGPDSAAPSSTASAGMSRPTSPTRCRRADRRQPVPAKGCRRHPQDAAKFEEKKRFLDEFGVHLGHPEHSRGSGRRWRLEYRSRRGGHQELAGQPQEPRIPLPHEREWVWSAGVGMVRCRPGPAPTGSGTVQLVVVAR